jgi:hypothetical protein
VSSLTARQKQYIWLMGSFPEKVAVQGRGYRTSDLLYGFDEDELVIFGYSDPFLWLENRGLIRKLANHPKGRVLTDEGETVFGQLLLSGFGALAPVREVKVAPKVRT